MTRSLETAGILSVLMLSLHPSGAPAADSSPRAIEVAQFTADGELLRPAGLENWVFVGTSLGMGYNEAQFNPQAPGLFQVVQVEPSAFRYFMEHGQFAPGSMLLLSFYGADTRLSNNKTGYVQSELKGQEIHLIDPARTADSGHVFFGFRPGGSAGKPAPPGNDCVRCHLQHGAYQGVFFQFYPLLSGRIPKEALQKALADHDIH